jgi:hypothetical protein
MSSADEDLHQRLRAAADRLIAGAPRRSSGKLTIVDLAAEAGIKRWILTHRHPELMRQYQDEFQALLHTPPALQRARDENTRLAQELAEARRRNRDLDETVKTYATLINELTDQLAAARVNPSLSRSIRR